MRFSADQRLLEILVGSNLYPDPEVSIRELVQNSWEAIEWRRTRGDGGGSEILIRFDSSASWIEVVDDGIGMDAEDFKESFLRVGRSKLQAIASNGSPGEQVALFGIGVLSAFLVADAITVQSRKHGSLSGFAATIASLTEDFEIHDIDGAEFGTTIRLILKPGVDARALSSAGVDKYVRHVPNVFLVDAEANTRTTAAEQWAVEDFEDVREAQPSSTIRAGRLGLSRGLADVSHVFRNQLTLCNLGFLVEAQALDFLPESLVLGIGGELDLHAGALSIVMARERYQRDDRWRAFQAELLVAAETIVADALRSGQLHSLGPSAMRRALLLWHWQLTQHSTLPILLADVADRVFNEVEWSIAERDPRRLADLVAGGVSRLYARRLDQARQRARHIDDEGLPLQLVEEIRDSIRVGALMARGFSVLEVGPLQTTIQTPDQTATYSLSEFDILAALLAARDIELRDIASAPPEDLDLSSVERLPVLRNILDVNGELRFASVPDSDRRVVTDPSGIRYLNVRNLTIRRLLRVLPSAVSNPLRRRLLDIYLGIEDFRLGPAREAVLSLIESEELLATATAETSPLTSEVVRRAVERLMGELE